MKKGLFYSLAIIALFLSISNVQGDSPFDHCLYLEHTICFEKGNTCIPEDNDPPGLVGFWKFDDKYAVDYSGNRNQPDPIPKVGPAQGGKGYAAYFNGTDMSIIKHIPAYESREFTVTFWIFLLPGNMEGIRTILHKGSRPQEMTPTIQLWPKDDTRLHVRTSTDELSNDGLDSNSYLPMRKWTHVTVSYSNELLQLYIDGLLDSQTILHGHIKINKGDWHIGRDPWHGGVSCYLDNLKFYNIPLKQTLLMATAPGNLQVVDGKFFSVIGCKSCNFEEALTSCPDGYHLCSLQELYSGGYHTARSMGWFRNNKDIWFRPDNKTISMANSQHFADPMVFKLGACCPI